MTHTAAMCPECSGGIPTMEGVSLAFCPHCRFPLMEIAGKYKLLRKLGEGGFGLVYLARHIGLPGDVYRVLKVIREEMLDNEQVIRRFHREIRVTASLSEKNPHIVRIFDDFGEAPKLGHFYVMEYLQGQTLKEDLARKEPRSPAWIFGIFGQLCEAVSMAHTHDIVHRDLKPDNVFLLDGHGEIPFVKVLDFGIAKSLVEQQSASANTQGILGTPLYMPPEQFLNQEVSAQSDQYTLAGILFEMLSGELPHGRWSTDTIELFTARLSEPPASLAGLAVDPRLASALDPVMQKALAVQPAQRYTSVSLMWNAIVAAVKLALPDLPLPKADIDGGVYAHLPTGNFTAEPAAFEEGRHPLDALTTERPSVFLQDAPSLTLGQGLPSADSLHQVISHVDTMPAMVAFPGIAQAEHSVEHPMERDVDATDAQPRKPWYLRPLWSVAALCTLALCVFLAVGLWGRRDNPDAGGATSQVNTKRTLLPKAPSARMAGHTRRGPSPRTPIAKRVILVRPAVPKAATSRRKGRRRPSPYLVFPKSARKKRVQPPPRKGVRVAMQPSLVSPFAPSSRQVVAVPLRRAVPHRGRAHVVHKPLTLLFDKFCGWGVFRLSYSRRGFCRIQAPMKKPLLRWRHQLPGRVVAPLIYYQKKLYVGLTDRMSVHRGRLQVLSVTDGKALYGVGLKAGIVFAPLVTSGGVYVTSGQAVHKFSFRGLRPRWQANARWNVRGSPTIVKGILYFGASDKVMRAYDIDAENFIWQRSKASKINAAVSVLRDQLYIATYNGILSTHSLSGKLLGQTDPLGATIFEAVAVTRQYVFVGAGKYLHAIDRRTSRIVWKRSVDGQISTPPSVDNRQVYVGTDKGKMYAFSRDMGRPIWSYPTGAGIYSAPFVTNQVILFGSNDAHLYALDKTTGKFLWKYKAAARIRSAPLVVGGAVFFADYLGNVYALQ